MKNRCAFVLLLALCFSLCAAPALRAQVVVLSNLGTPTLASAQIKSSQYVAQSFVTSADTFQLNSVGLRMNSALDASGNFSVHVVTGDSVPHDDLGSGGFDAVLTGNANPASSSTYFYSASSLILQGNTTYWLLLEVASGAGNYRWFFPNSTAVQASTWTMGGTIATTLDQGANWTTTSIPPFNPYMFSITATAIPEPSTYAALAGVGALGLALRRRRPARVATRG